MKVTIQQKDDVTLVRLEASDGEHKSFSYNKGSVRFLRCVRALAKIDEEYSVSEEDDDESRATAMVEKALAIVDVIKNGIGYRTGDQVEAWSEEHDDDGLTISQWMGFISGESDAQLPKE